MRDISIDIETYSSVDITEAGLYKYAQSEDFEILLFAYKVDDEEVKIVDLKCGEDIPPEIIRAMWNPGIQKHAYNAAFEFYCLMRAGYIPEDDIPGLLSQWHCTMHHGMYLGYPAGLAMIGNAIGLDEDKKKMSVGKALIKYFCTPCKPTKSNGQRTRNLPQHDTEKWVLFKEYCKQDVVTEFEVQTRLSAFPVPEMEHRLWVFDVLMNTKGIKVDTELIEGALIINGNVTQDLVTEAVSLTGLENPNSQQQLLKWLNNEGVDVDNIRKDTVSDLLEDDSTPLKVKRVLEIRQRLGKSSVAKYEKMKTCMGEGDRVRGLLQVYGANRTGRWAGRLVQIQNLPRNYIKTLDVARDIVKAGNAKMLNAIYGNIQSTLSELIRTAFIPSFNNHFVVADFSAIEARVIAWVAGEKWVNDVFATHGKIYEATASQMFNVPIEKISKGNPEYSLRQKGKVATLALGYQGGVNALKTMGAERMGLEEDELPEIVEKWRGANPNIVKFWYAVESAALNVIDSGIPQNVRGLIFRKETDILYGQTFLTVELPSGRKLFYPKPFLKENRFGKMALHFWAMNQTTKKWTIDSTYGGKMSENIVQAIARDCLAVTLLRIYEKYGNIIVAHIHDEVILDCSENITLEEICEIMSIPPDWAKDLVTKAAGFTSYYYMKD